MNNNNNNIAEMAVFNVAGYLIEERRRWPVVTAHVNEWNKLPGECVNATSINMSKNKFDDFFRRTRQVNN